MTEREKWLHTMMIYDDYERRFAKARTQKPLYTPTTEKERTQITEKVKKILGFREDWIPTVHGVEEVLRQRCERYDIVQLRYQTWDGFYGSATYYEPRSEGKHPLSFTLCGHGQYGRRTSTTATMAYRLAELGFASIVPDNIGQGDRLALGHWEAFGPEGCGITLQGMIVMETIGVIRYMMERPEIDKKRVVACGNSGGGTLTLLLAALAPELSAIASSGYPSEFHYILSKERGHCSCNLLPGIAHGPEMWEILSCFAPKPLFIEQGRFDDLIPYDYFERCARKVAHCYRAMGAENNFSHANTLEKHPWKETDIAAITEFLARSAGLPFVENDVWVRYEDIPHWKVTPPSGTLKTDEMAEILTGKKLPESFKLSDIFTPKYEGKPIDPETIIPNLGRGDVLEILAQMESALAEEESWGF